MKILPSRVIKVLGYNFFLFFNVSSPCFINNSLAVMEAEKILKNFRIEIKRNSIICDDFIYVNPFISKEAKIEIKIEPYKNIAESLILSLEEILNNPDNVCTSYLMAPLFDCMGWILNNNSGKWKLEFIGSPTYEIWKEQMLVEEIDSWKEPDEKFNWWKLNGGN